MTTTMNTVINPEYFDEFGDFILAFEDAVNLIEEREYKNDELQTDYFE